MIFAFYIFVLYILFIPGILLKKYYDGYLNSLLFIILFYFTINFVKCTEGFGFNIEVSGANNLVEFKNKTVDNIDIQYDNDITHKPFNYSTGNELIDILNETSPAAIEEIELKNEIFDYKGKDQRIYELRKKIVKLNEDIFNMQSELMNYGKREDILEKLKNKDSTIKMDTDDLEQNLNFCKERTKLNKTNIIKLNTELIKLKKEELESQNEFNTVNKNHISVLDKYNMLQNSIQNYHCTNSK